MLLSLRKHFLKIYGLAQQNISDEEISALLLYFAIGYLQQDGSLKVGIGQINKSELLALSNYIFAMLRDFLPAEIVSAFAAPDTVALEKAKLFYESGSLKDEIKKNLFQDIANLGFAYQIFNSHINKKALIVMQSANKKISRQQLIAFTQIYTPNWVVDFLVANTVLPSFMHWRDRFPLRYGSWLIPEQLHGVNNVDLANFNILDPACGAGQFLFSAFDLVSSLSEFAGYGKSESVEIALNNIYGADIDEKALWVAGLGLLCKSLLATGKAPKKLSNLSWSGKNEKAGFLGSIDKSWPKQHILSQSYQAVITNPPYIGRKCLSRELKTSLQEQYPDSSADLCAAFLRRSVQMLKLDGRLGVITQSSLLSISSYQSLRHYLFNNYHFETIVRCGPGIFPLSSGEKIDSVLLIAKAPNRHDENIGQKNTCLYDLSFEKDKCSLLQKIIKNSSGANDCDSKLSSISKSQIVTLTDNLAFGLPYSLLDKLSSFPKLGEIAEIRQGLATTDNARFVRYHFDVDPQLIGNEWVPYIKGAGAEKFASDNPFVVKWGNNGEEIKQAVSKAYPYLKGKTAWVVKNEEFYFRPGLCFSFINKSGLAVRRLPPGAIFDVGSSAIFASPEDEDFLLAYLNSSLVGLLAKTINQTINVQVGDLKKLPIFPFPQECRNELAKLGQECYLAKQKLLHLQRIDITDLRENNSSLISGEQLDLFFIEHEAEHRRFSEHLINSRVQIDRLVIQGAEHLNIFGDKESYLNSLLQSAAIDMKNIVSVFSPELFAHKFMVALVSFLLSGNQSAEEIRLVTLTEKDSLARLLGLSDSGKKWLEARLGQSLEQIFCRPKVVDISKLAKEPSRYFSVWFAEDDTCMFFSAVSVRQILKSSDLAARSFSNPPLWTQVLAQLSHIKDWTSKDLFSISMSLLASFQ